MTRPSVQSSVVTVRAGRIACVQDQSEGRLAVLIAESGGSQPSPPEATLTDRAQVPELLKSRKVELVIRLVPASQTVCRILPLPGMTGEDRAAMADALSLLAEAELPSSLPWHRRAAGILQLDGRAAAVLTGWVPSASDSTSASPLSTIPEVWLAEIAALAGLAHAAGAGAMVGVADRPNSSLSLLAFGPKRSLGRTLRLSASGSAWPEAVRQAWSESAAAAGIDVPVPGTDGLLMNLPGTVRLAGANRDREWIGRYGLALGAVSLYSDPDAAVSALVGLTPGEPQRATPIVQRAVDWLSLPRNAAIVASVCVGLLLLAPWGAAQVRYSMLRTQAGPLPELSARLTEADRRAEFYKLLGQKRWPMTKLLADIAGATPVGVMVESIELSQGDPVTIRASAETSELVSAFRKNLGDTRVFTRVETPTIEASAQSVSFTLQARLAPEGAITNSKPIQDFATKTLAQHLYGDDAVSYSGSDDVRDTDASDSGDRREDRRSSSQRERNEPSRSASSRAERSPTAAAPVIPAALSDADINAMDRTAAMKEWGVRRKASTQAGLDPATKERLAAEAEKCRARMQAAAASGGSGT